MLTGISKRLSGKLRYELAKLVKPEMIAIAKNNGTALKGTRVSNFTHISYPENLLLGNHVFIGHFNYIDCFRKTIIEDGCQLSNYISILNHSSHFALRLYGEAYLHEQDHKGMVTGEVRIGKYTYIGPHSVIMPAVDIGMGSLVSAFSFLPAGKFPDFSILKGNPAKVIGDTRNLDSHLLEENPGLRAHYEKWSK